MNWSQAARDAATAARRQKHATYFMRDCKRLRPPRLFARIWHTIIPVLAGVGFVAVLVLVQGVDDWALRPVPPAPPARRDAAARPPACPEGWATYSWRADAGGKWQTICGPAKALSGGGGLRLYPKPTKPP